ncbi:SRPBCC domain-containing protein [Natrialba sp. PRR66]|uniref:SRPBCC domain-containing protein n=1 Tax=Natrialba sp. PRR66 TaxID=3098146 RepID=UPI002B1D21A9|nr:SRPBCC domain-containing protein [Natrialba sp. PRR66]
MTDPVDAGASTQVTMVIDAPREEVYRAFLDPDAVATWLPPDGMDGHVHYFDPREGGEFRISLTYRDPRNDSPGGGGGKTADDTDTHRGRFVALVPHEKIVETIEFETTDQRFAGEMRVTVSLEETDEGTAVTYRCENIPQGIRLEDNEAGNRSSVRNLAELVE